MAYTASSNPFANAGTSMFGQETSSGGLGSVLGSYLANETGLIDLNDPDQKSNLQKNGLINTIYGNQFSPTGSVPPTDMKGFQQKSTGNPYQIQMVAPPNQLGSETYTPTVGVNPQAARDTLIPQTGGNTTAANNQPDQYSGSGTQQSEQGFGDTLKSFASLFEMFGS